MNVALPFLTALCPSERYGPYVRRGRRHKPLPERARGLIGQVRRWLPDRALIVVADSRYAALELLAWCARQARPVTLITRLRLDAALSAPAPVFSLVALMVQRQPAWQGAFRRSAWYEKAQPTFADALAQVRRALWRQLGFWLSEAVVDKQKPSPKLFEHFAELLAYIT